MPENPTLIGGTMRTIVSTGRRARLVKVNARTRDALIGRQLEADADPDRAAVRPALKRAGLL